MERVLSVVHHTKCVGWACREKEQKYRRTELTFNSVFQFQPFKIFLNWGSSLCIVFSPQMVCSWVWPDTQNVYSITDQTSDVLLFPFWGNCGNPQLEVSHSYNPVTGKCMIVSPAVLLIQLTHILGCANSKDVMYIHYISQQTADNLAGQELVATSWCNGVAHQLVYSHLSPLLRLT